MLKINKLLLVMSGVSVLGGCSVYQAVHAPTPIEYKQVKLGATRTEALSYVGFPKMTDQKDNQKTDSFEFIDGYNAASKVRVILYLAGDIFTVGLSELIFWPIEAYGFDGKQCRGTITYNARDQVIGYDIMGNKGEHLWFSPLATADK